MTYGSDLFRPGRVRLGDSNADQAQGHREARPNLHGLTNHALPDASTQRARKTSNKTESSKTKAEEGGRREKGRKEARKG
jgi:hypothetical protein